MLLQVRIVYFFSMLVGIEGNEVGYRLPKNVRPIRYNLTIIPDFEKNRFSGTVSIEILVLQNSSSITMHYYQLRMPPKEHITVEALKSNKKLRVIAAGPAETTEHEYFRILLAEKLEEGIVYTVTIPNFIANFSERVGFMKNYFTESTGATKTYAFTHFQPCYARRAFPCFDEPSLRAKFNINLVRPSENFISASNTRIISQSKSEPFEDVFEESLEMPTYLVAFTISEMQFSETVDCYRIIARPEALSKNEHKYALNATVKIVNFMKNYTKVPFPLAKLDQLAIEAFAGGMENWGLIIYNERYLLLNFNTEKKLMVRLIAHEIAHQWFGNLVGLTWWEYVWLTEGFATYFQNLIQVEPLVDGRGAFLQDMQELFQYDIKSYTRPLSHNEEISDYVMGLFDSIAYTKGAIVLRMLETSLTTPVFQKGVQNYVQKMKFKPAAPVDLYQSLQKALDEDSNASLPDPLTVASVMFSWEYNLGFPIVDVHREYGVNGKVKLMQKRYVDEPISEEGKWTIPINFATSNNQVFENTTPEYWITEQEQRIAIPNLKDKDWLIVNKQVTGYYRVNYDEKNWNRIIKALITNHLDIHVLNRAQLIDDSLSLAKSGHLNYNISIELIKYISCEKDPIPWKSYCMNTRKIRTMFYYSSMYNTVKEFNFNITRKVYDLVGFENKMNESLQQKDLRKIILSLLCQLDHPDILRRSYNKFKFWQKHNKSLFELDEITLCGAIRGGSQKEFNLVYDLLQAANSPNPSLINGLSCSKNISNLQKLLEVRIKIPRNELMDTVADSGPEGLQATVNYIVSNFPLLESKFEETIVIVFRKLCEKISTLLQLNALKLAVQNSKYLELIETSLAESEINVKWRNCHSEDFIKQLLKIST